MNLNEALFSIASGAIPFLCAITLHEVAHGWVARACGDRTAEAQGRLSLNPLEHVDPLGTLILPGILILMGAPFLLGWAKPVPVNPNRLRDPRWDMVKVAAAGPGANVVMALGWAVLGVLVLRLRVPGSVGLWFYAMAASGVKWNLFLAAFNLMPILPLDGGRVLANTLPRGPARAALEKLEPWGMVIVLGLTYARLLIWPITILFNLLLGLVFYTTGYLLPLRS